jgi:hypothetical protein
MFPLCMPTPSSSRTAPEVLCRRAEAAFRQRRIAVAERHFRAALATGASPVALAEKRWMCAMLRGDFSAAWQISDTVLRTRAGQSAAHLPHHLRWVWDGTPLAGRTVLVRCYHGLGDTLQFIRLAPRLKRIADRVIVEAQPELLPLLASARGIDHLVPLDSAAVPGAAVEIESMEVPHALRLPLPDIPAEVPYLAVPDERLAAARRLVAKYPGRLKVGVTWAAGQWDARRSLPLEALRPLAALPEVVLFSLQRGPALEALARTGAPPLVRPLGEAADMLETAAIVSHLDLIVTVDTMIAHLAGAIARPVWTLLHYGADWRWLLDREDSPWYPTMRLFRQSAPGAWKPVVVRLAGELSHLRPPRGEDMPGAAGFVRPPRVSPQPAQASD